MKKNIVGILLLALFFSLSCKKNTGINIDPDTLIKDEVYEQLYEDSALNVLFTYYATENPGKKTRGFQGCPTVGYKDGVYFVAWMCGVKDEEPGSYLCVSSSLDSGKTWSKNELLIVPKVDTCRQIDPCFWLDKGGDLHLSWTYVKKGIWDGGEGGLWHVKIKSEAGKILMTKPEQLGVGIMNVKPTNALDDTTAMYFPINNWNFTNTYIDPNKYSYYATPFEKNAPFIFKGIYNPKYKKMNTPVVVAKIPTSYTRTFDEHNIVDLGGNKLTCFFRTNEGIIAQSFSYNKGLTWSAQKIFNVFGNTTSSRFCVRRLSSGNVIFILNNDKERKNLTAYLSEDNGNTWPYKLVIEARECSYPDLVEDSEGYIWVVFDRFRWIYGQIHLVKISEKIIKNGVIPIENRFLVNQLKEY